MTMHIAEYQTSTLVNEEELADVIYLPSMPVVELGIQELEDELNSIAKKMNTRREVCAINLEVNEEDLELTPSLAESQRLKELRENLTKLKAVQESIAHSIRIAREDKIRDDEEREYQYFITGITN